MSVISIQKQWLAVAPWEKLVATNEALCQAKKLTPELRPKVVQRVRELWDPAVVRSMSLEQALDLCRECQSFTPFTFNNGNTFAAIAQLMVEDWAKALNSAEAQILRNTVGHYSAGKIGKPELVQVLKYFEKVMKSSAISPAKAANPAQAASPSAKTAPETPVTGAVPQVPTGVA